ncbi:hypothetical protein OG429_04540 [Streptomyces sp. NBC_00190]|uniref:hypothetical protein n=1 Tax=unclassified Streptomyces TaxID=2593676 RepID=UPI002E281E81|nr:hypothetical protein [Streptomyces sp. NBC_00190]WSZ38658.1 hypothetical protein OG239_07545 [Streptomyces sp. NBC_00868]
MRIKRILAATALLASLPALAACEDAEPGAAAAVPTAIAGAPEAAPTSLAEAQKYVQRYASCEKMGTQADDSRLPLTDLTTVGKWSVTERGVCSDRVEHGEIIFYMASDMKEFQAGYKQRVMEQIAAGKATYGLNSRVFVGKNYAVTPTSTKTALALARSDLRILTCNPTFGVPKGYKKETALVDGCVLSDFVGSADGSGSPNFETPQDDPAAAASEKPGQPAQGSLGLPRAGSLDELKKMVHPNIVDCTNMSTAPDAVAIQSIDYLPVVAGDPLGWGVKERAVCGEPAGERRAHDLNWLDVVRDMKTLQLKAKAAQQADLKDDGRLKATASRLLVGENIAVETNSREIRHGLYQLQFLYLNCEPGFSAPAGYRLEKSQVEGCVLTNYEH